MPFIGTPDSIMILDFQHLASATNIGNESLIAKDMLTFIVNCLTEVEKVREAAKQFCKRLVCLGVCVEGR